MLTDKYRGHAQSFYILLYIQMQSKVEMAALGIPWKHFSAFQLSLI